MANRFFKLNIALLFVVSGIAEITIAQCPAGYTQAQINWDKLDYYFNSGTNIRPYGYGTGTYVTDAMEQTQKYSIGPNQLTIATSSAALINPGNFNGVTGENAIHTGNIAGYTGDDVQYNPSANGQTITLTFNSEVRNVSFTLYDVDRSQRIDFNALNAIAAPQNINIVNYASSILTINNNNTPTARITANTNSLANNSNQGSATITVAGPVLSITITITTVGSDAVFWLSDINACVTGTFPNNYNQTGQNRPFYGPVTSQPDYFILTPDNDSAFMIDPVSGNAWFLFTDPSKNYMNSFAYDPYNKRFYYISENAALDQNNKALKMYDFNTETISTIVPNLTTLLNIPTFNSGVESAGAAYYNGQLFIGFEGGRYNTSNPRESIIFRLDLNALGIPINASQTFASNSYSTGGAALHDWADFIIENGILYNYNSRPGTSIIAYEHFNMMSGASTQYLNPSSSVGNAYQAGLTWAGQQYSFSNNTITPYNENGTLGTPVTITSAEGLSWKNGAGDASENFRPKCDFGDAPASYDPYSTPATQSPAVHERTDSIRLGPTWDREWLKNGTTGIEDVDDGLTFQTVLPPGSGTSFYAFVSAYNNSGSNATLIAWLDYNGNGIFDASEAIVPVTVPSSPVLQSIGLWWPSTPNTFSIGQTTYMRIRITNASAGMTASHATGYFRKGEVEDYRVLIDNYPLATQLISFNATVEINKQVKLDWAVEQEAGTFAYEIERSSDGFVWNKIYDELTNGNEGSDNYSTIDNNPLKGVSFYRLRIKENTGNDRLSPVKRITINDVESAITVSPIPAKNQITIQFESANESTAEIGLFSVGGKALFIKNEKVISGINKVSIQLPATIANGTYIVRLTIGKTVIHKKIIIAR